MKKALLSTAISGVLALGVLMSALAADDQY
jgi:hypothetical protein